MGSMKHLVAASTVVASLVFGSGTVTTAEPKAPDIPYFDDATGPTVSVNGNYQPIVGRFTSLELDDIIWYAPGATTDHRWTPCSGCEAGPFTSSQLVPQVGGQYAPIVGDFAGDGHDDIFWFAFRGGADHLWTTSPSGTFTSTRLDMADAYRSGDPQDYGPVVLPDTGSGKDDILWTKFMPSREGERVDIRYALWVFPDDGSGLAHTVARGARPLGHPSVGDYDGNGVADIFWYAAKSGCTCPEPGPAEMIDTYWRRSSSEAPGFTATTRNVKGEYLPIVGRLSAGNDARDDILWDGAINLSRSGYRDGPDSFWQGQSNGGFAASTVELHAPGVEPGAGPPLSPGFVLEHGGPDTVLFPLYDLIWFQTPSGPVLRETGAEMSNLRWLLIGRFTTADRDDAFSYVPGPAAEHLYHPID